MSLTNFYRLSAGAAMLGGVFIMVKKLFVELFLPLNVATNAMGTVGLLLTFFSLTGMYLYQREALGRWGFVTYLINWFGLGAVAGLDYTRLFTLPFLERSITAELLAGPTMTVFFVSALIFLSGVILFGTSMLRANVFPRLPILMYVIGFVPYSLPTLFPDPVVRIAQVVATLGIMAMGYFLWTAMKEPQTTQVSRATATAS
jgi:hypothetical protein